MKRDSAEMWARARADFAMGMKYQEIADKYGVSLSAVKSRAARHWKKETKVATARKRSQSGTRGKGAPIGNRNAVGHGGTPGNQNALKTGEYAAIWMDTLTEDEQALCDVIDTDPLTQIDENIRLLTIRERRMLANIKALKDKKDLAETEEVYREDRNADGELRLKEMTRYRKLLIDKIILAEEALTRVQEKKLRAIETKYKMMKDAEGKAQEQNLEIIIRPKEGG